MLRASLHAKVCAWVGVGVGARVRACEHCVFGEEREEASKDDEACCLLRKEPLLSESCESVSSSLLVCAHSRAQFDPCGAGACEGCLWRRDRGGYCLRAHAASQSQYLHSGPCVGTVAAGCVV